MASLEINEFWKRKVKFYFNEVLDYDQDGQLNRKDVETFKELYKHMRNLKQNSAELEKFSKFLTIWIDSIVEFSKTSNGSIDFEDFYKYCLHIRSQLIGKKSWPTSLHFMSDYIDALFNIFDSDGDGHVSKQDFFNSYANVDDQNTREKCWQMLWGIDTEKIDKKVFEELCLEFLVSTNPNDRGNWIFGIY
jgi:Ca2+-binding EF-hand superfamily protein